MNFAVGIVCFIFVAINLCMITYLAKIADALEALDEIIAGEGELQIPPIKEWRQASESK